MSLSLSDFAVKLVESGLITQSALDEWLGALPATDRPRDGETLARLLVQRQLLTPYQAQAIADGNGKTLVLGNYVVQDQLGQGGMGVVLKAVHRRMDRTVALKVLSAESVKTPSLVERFHREVKAAARLEHPNIVTAHDADEASGIHFLVMQYVEGQDLAAVVRQRGPLAVSEAVHCVLQAARGLEYAHRHGVIHRDIKPGNLLLSKDGTVKILDMGLARIDNSLAERHEDHSLTGSGMVMGTVDYMSPEQALNTRHADARSDQYSLGITLYFLLTGRPAYAGDSAMEKLLAHRDAPLPSLDHLSPELNAIFQKMAAKKPADRFTSMTEVVAALSAVQAQLIGEPTATYAPMGNLPSSPAAATPTTAALAAFLQAATPAVQTSATPQVAVAAEVSAADVPTILGSGAVEDTATTWRQTPTPRFNSKRSRLVAVIAASAVMIGLIGWLAITSINRSRDLQPIADQLPDANSSSAEPDSSADSRPTWNNWPADAPQPAIAPFDAEQAKKHREEWAAYLGVPVEYTNSIGMKFVLIPPGEFLMGSTQEEIDVELKVWEEYWHESIKSYGPQHKVILTQPFYLGVGEVTQAEYEKVMGKNPSFFAKSGPDMQLTEKIDGLNTTGHPVENVSWIDAADFCAVLSVREKLKPSYVLSGETVTTLNGTGYRLPTEAQWEFACRAGTTMKYWTGDDDGDVMKVGWCTANSGGRTHATGQLKENPLGIHDVYGNVHEWVEDWWSPDSYNQFLKKPAIDPTNGDSGRHERVVRGGSWHYNSTSSSRHHYGPTTRRNDFGFRAVLPIDSVRQAFKEQKSPAWHGWAAGAPKPAIVPFDTEQAKQHQAAWAKHLGVPVEYTNSIGMKFVLIPPGEFLRGSSPEEQKKYREESPRNPLWLKAITTEGPKHRTILTQPFYLSVYETTQSDYQKVLGVKASEFSAGGKHAAIVAGMDTSQFPVDHATWLEAVEFCEKLSLNEQLPVFYTRQGEHYAVPAGKGYRLPTEAEWEYACRAGTTSAFWTGDDEHELASIAWYKENSDQRPHSVGELAANPFGLFDILGNIFEWCHDGSTPGPSSYEKFADSPAIDPVVNPEEQPNLLRKCRGGMFSNRPGFCRAALRNHFEDSAGAGFRLALSVDAVKRSMALSDSPQRFALEFDGIDDFVTVPDFHVAEDQPLTLECIVVAEKPTGPSQALLLASDAFASIGTGQMNWGTVAIWGGKERLFFIKDSIVPGKRTHLALTFADDNCVIYVDGNSDASQPYRFSTPPVKTVEHVLYIGSGGSSSQRFRGRIEGVRVSKQARYSENFTPPTHFEKDDDTLALYRFTEGQGELLYDSSGNDRHGKITNAKWVKLGKSEQAKLWPSDAPQPAIAPFDAAQAKQHQEAWAKYLGVPVDYENSLGMKFRLIPPGEFKMGSTPAEIEATLKLIAPQNLRFQNFIRSEGPQHRVVLTRPFYLGATEVTQADYQTILRVQPSHFSASGAGRNDVAGLQTGRHPAENVSWLNAVDFCNRLSQRCEFAEMYRVDGSTVELLAGDGYRLPTEAEWEFACRAGTTTLFASGADEGDLKSVGWMFQNGGGRTHPVGELGANPFGLADMHGNLWEWCYDHWRSDQYRLGDGQPVINPTAVADGPSEYVVRGGSWSAPPLMCRSAMRNSFAADARDFNTGFRLALSVEAVQQAAAHVPSLLSCDGDGDYVEVAKFPPCQRDTVMLEAWVRPKAESDAANVISWLGPNWISLFQSGDKWGVGQRLDDGSRVMISEAAVVPDQWVHLAASFEGGELKLYVNGKPATLERIEFPLEPTEQGLYLGGCPVEKLKHDGERWFHGDIRQVRISHGIRNSAAFIPEQKFLVDEATLVNYDFRKRDDEVLYDLTGKQDSHGKIVGAKWETLAPDDEFALEFDGEKAWVSLPLKEDRDPPWTLEAWVKRRKPNRLSTIIAAFEAPRGMGLSEFEHQLEAGVSRENNRMWSVAPSSKPLDPQRFQHVAAVLESHKLRVFLDGVRVAEVEFQERHLPSNAAFGVGGYQGIDLFSGWIDEIRISDSARYEENFTPKRRFVADSDTLVLYHCDDGEGDVLTDSSGHDRHGKLHGTKWARISQVEESRSGR